VPAVRAAAVEVKVMSRLGSSSSVLAADAIRATADAGHDERLPVPVCALIVVALSLGLWTGIALIVRAVIG
jgi:hypothetical protein